MRFAQDLEAVADAQHGHAALGRGHDLRHHWSEAGDRTAAKVVAVRETARQDDGVDAFEVVVAVPEGDCLTARDADGTLRVGVIQRSWEGDDTDPHA